jgi:caffeoyl-CoA O-methyltransferase
MEVHAMKKCMVLLAGCMALLLTADAALAQPSGGRGARSSMDRGGQTSANDPVPKDDAEKKVLNVLKDMDQNQRGGMMNVPAADGRLLRLLAEAVGAKNVVEIGTSNGYSGIWFCLALRTTGGKLTTHEIDSRRAALARENFVKAGVEKIVTLVEGNAHEEVKKLKEPIDILFIDADKEGYYDYLTKLLPLVKPGGLIVSHNMEMFRNDSDYFKAITANPEIETVFQNTQSGRIAISLKKR